MNLAGDLLYVGLSVLFFGLTWAFVKLCERAVGGRHALLYVVGGIVSVGLLVYLVLALLKPELFSMTANGILQLVALRGRAARAGQAARRVHGARLRGPAVRAGSRRSAGSSGSSIGCAGVGPTEEMGWKTLRAGDAALQPASGCSPSTRCSACRACCRSTRRAWPPSSPDSSFNTAVSFATNTNWQGYGGETTMSYLTQMLGLTVQNFVSAATGMAVLVALIRGFARRIGRRRSATSGSI